MNNSEAQEKFDSFYYVDNSTSNSVITIHSIKNVPPITYNVQINGVPITMELDSGPCYSLCNSNYWKQLGRPEPRDVSQNELFVLGIAYVNVSLNDQNKQLRVVFIDSPDTASLLGREWIAEFNRFKVQQTIRKVLEHQVSRTLESLLSEFNDLFDIKNLPPINGFKAHLHVRPEAQYRFFKPRPVPYALRSKIETWLTRLKSLGIISKVNAAQFSTTPMVPVI